MFSAVYCLRAAPNWLGTIPKGKNKLNMTFASKPSPTKGQGHSDVSKLPKATFGAGCFWGVEDEFRRLPGVVATWTGYSGGKVPRPSYEQVCTHETGHAEVVEVYYNPSKVSYNELLNIFWRIHDPTTPNRQGPDVGTNYRSVIYTHSDEQQKEALASREKLAKSKRYDSPIVTQIQAAGQFFPAEEYHQRYHEKNGGSCNF